MKLSTLNEDEYFEEYGFATLLDWLKDLTIWREVSNDGQTISVKLNFMDIYKAPKTTADIITVEQPTNQQGPVICVVYGEPYKFDTVDEFVNWYNKA
jgi:hypothetical protein